MDGFKDARFRRVWEWPECPEGHGRIFVEGSRNKTNGNYQCSAPWCPCGIFEAPEGWHEEFDL